MKISSTRAWLRIARGGRTQLILVLVIALVTLATWFGTAPKAFSVSEVDGTAFLNSYQSNPLLVQGLTLEPTISVGSLGTFLGLPARSSDSSIEGTPVNGGTLLLSRTWSGAVGNVNFLDQSGLVASAATIRTGGEETTLAQAFPTASGVWVVTRGQSATVWATDFSNTKDLILGLESGVRPTVAKLTRPFMSAPSMLAGSTAKGKPVGGAGFSAGSIVASASSLWGLQSDGYLVRDDGVESTSFASVGADGKLNSNPGMSCVVVADAKGLKAFSETQADRGPASEKSFPSSKPGAIQPVRSIGNDLYFMYVTGQKTELVNVNVGPDCQLANPKETNMGTSVTTSSGVVAAWNWATQNEIVVGLSRPSMSFRSFSTVDGKPSKVAQDGPILFRGSPVGVRSDLQFVGYSTGYIVNDPAASQVAVVALGADGKGGKQQEVRWIKRTSVASYDAQAAPTTTQQLPKQPKSQPMGRTVKFLSDPKCQEVQPNEKIVLRPQPESTMASSVTIRFDQPSDGTCTSSAFMAYYAQAGGSKQSEECESVQRMGDGSFQCVVTKLRASTTYQISVAAMWGATNRVAPNTESDPITVTTINIDLRMPENVAARYNSSKESWDVTWSGNEDDQATIWRVDTGVCAQEMIVPVATMAPLFSRTFGSLSIPLKQHPTYFGQNLQFAVAPGLLVNGKVNFAPPTSFTSCQWTPPSSACNSYQKDGRWVHPILVSGSVPDSSSGAVANMNVVVRSIAAKCYLGQAEIVYQWKIDNQAGSKWTDCIKSAAWQPDYVNPALTYAQNCYVGASAAAIKTGNAEIMIRYRIVLPNGTAYQDLSNGQRVAAGSLVQFSWPAPGTVRGSFSYVDGTAKNANALPNLAIALEGLVTPGQSIPDFSIPSLPVITCTGTFGQSPEVSLGSLNSSIDPVNGVPTVTLSDNGGANYDLVQAVGGKCTITLVLQISTHGDGVSSQVVLNQTPITPSGSSLVANPNFPTKPTASWFALCVNGSTLTLSIDTSGPCATSGSGTPPGAIVTPENIVATIDGVAQLVTPDEFYGGSGAPPLSYTFQLGSEPSSPVSLQFKWTYLNTTTTIKVTSA